MAVKYTAVLGIAAGIGAFCWTRRRVFISFQWTQWILLLGLVGLVAGPWMIRNWAATGNFFYPYLSRWMGGLSLPAAGLRNLLADHQAAFQNGETLGPWLGRVLGSDLDKTIGPIFFSFFPFFLLPPKEKASAWFLKALFFIFFGKFFGFAPFKAFSSGLHRFFCPGRDGIGRNSKRMEAPVCLARRGFPTCLLELPFLGAGERGIPPGPENLAGGRNPRGVFGKVRPNEGLLFPAGVLKFLPPSDRVLVAGTPGGFITHGPFSRTPFLTNRFWRKRPAGPRMGRGWPRNCGKWGWRTWWSQGSREPDRFPLRRVRFKRLGLGQAGGFHPKPHGPHLFQSPQRD